MATTPKNALRTHLLPLIPIQRDGLARAPLEDDALDARLGEELHVPGMRLEVEVLLRRGLEEAEGGAVNARGEGLGCGRSDGHCAGGGVRG